MTDEKNTDIVEYLEQYDIPERLVVYDGCRGTFMKHKKYYSGGEEFPPTGDRQEFLVISPSELEKLIKEAKKR